MCKCMYSGITKGALLLCIFFLASCNSFKEMKPVHEEKTFTAEGIDSIRLKSTNAEVSFTSTSSQQRDIQIVLSGSTSADTVLFKANVVGSQLEIEYDEMLPIVGWFRSKIKLTVEIPKSHLAKIDVTNVSGSIDARNLEADSLLFNTTSGSLTITAFNGSLTANSVSGKMIIDELNGELIAKNKSGAIEAKKITGNTSANTTSGEIAINGLNGTVNAETTSGKISVQFDTAAYATKATSTSGSINITLPSASSFDYQMHSVSGSKRCDFNGGDIGTVGSGGPLIQLNTTSGSIDIIKS